MTNKNVSGGVVVGLGHVEALLVLHKQIAHTLDEFKLANWRLSAIFASYWRSNGDEGEKRRNSEHRVELLHNMLAMAIVALGLVLAACDTSAEDEASRRRQRTYVLANLTLLALVSLLNVGVVIFVHVRRAFIIHDRARILLDKIEGSFVRFCFSLHVMRSNI